MGKNRWVPILGYLNYYEINKEGTVRSLPRTITLANNKKRTIKPRILRPRLNNFGYLEVRLSKDGIATTKFIHILLAQAFICNLDNKKEINHKNGIKTDNTLENLEWVTHSENMQHAYNMGLINKCRPVIDICCGKIFKCSKEAADHYNIKHNTLRGYLNGQIKNKTCLRYQDAA